MNPLIKKEVRLLMPAWIGAMVLAIFPCWVVQCFEGVGAVTNDLTPPLFVMVGMILMAGTSFGYEISYKTFPLLLSQPIPRDRLWWIKISLLGAAFLSILAASLASWSLFVFCHPAYLPQFFKAYSGIEFWITAFAFSSGGLWATLLIRQIVGAFWVALFAPIAISVVINIALLPWVMSGDTVDLISSIACGCYAIAGFLYAHKLFMHAQDTQWLEGVFTLTWGKGGSEQTTGSLLQGRRHRLVALFFKEVQIHQVNILIAVVVLVLHLASVLVRKIHPHFEDAYIRYVLDEVWALWLLMPLLIGCSAIAEERKLGVMESQLCLPVSRRAQIFIKFFVALILSLFLGGLMPSFIEKTDMDGRVIFTFATVIFFISFYASSVSRTTIQAIGLAMLVAVILGVLEMAFIYLSSAFNPFLQGFMGNGYVQLGLFLAAFILLLLFIRLSFRNFKWLHQTAKILWHDGTALGLSFLAMAALTNAIYFRAWELFMPVEPAHGPVSLSASTLPKLLIGDGAVYALLADGRLWAEEIHAHYVHGSGAAYLSAGERFWVGGSNWTSIVVGDDRLLGIQSDGTLWAAQAHPNSFRFTMKRVGTDTNWTQIATGQFWDFNCLLLKSDGTLWRLDVLPFHSPHSIKLSQQIMEATNLPQYITGGTNFSAIFSNPLGYLKAIKNDGSIWFVFLDNKKPLYRADRLPDSVNDLRFGMGFVRLNTNGDLTLSLYQGRHPQQIQIGGNTKWRAVESTGNNLGFNSDLLAIRDDGTLWELKSPWPRGRDESLESWFKQIKVIQLGVYPDWITLISASESEYGTRALALSADGGLWGWDLPSAHAWLIPSRRPAWFGNVYQAASGNP